jgi:hypothetical protein
MDSMLHPSTVNGSHLIRPEIVLFKISVWCVVADMLSFVLRGGMDTQGWLSLKVS